MRACIICRKIWMVSNHFRVVYLFHQIDPDRDKDQGLVNSVKEVDILIERWRVDYNTMRPHSALGYKPRLPKR